MIRIFTFLLVFTTLLSCKKETDLTQAEKTQADLQRAINDKSVLQILVFEMPNTSSEVASTTAWSFSNGFIFVGGQTSPGSRNLTYLYRWEINLANNSTGTAVSSLFLYFK